MNKNLKWIKMIILLILDLLVQSLYEVQRMSPCQSSLPPSISLSLALVDVAHKGHIACISLVKFFYSPNQESLYMCKETGQQNMNSRITVPTKVRVP